MMLLDKEKRAKDKKAADEKLKAANERTAKLILETFSTPAGKETLNYLMHFCGFLDPSTPVHSAQDANYIPLATSYNEGRRGVYLTIRRFLMERDPNLLREIEFLIKEK